ncbi:hypothetical protein ACPW7J_11035 [Ihubacter sp. rT4E-8]|uniref:hypothetical protein n=1 Tax=unclassified Ihubacter TaxID=2633299 RepID=UPI003C7D0944
MKKFKKAASIFLALLLALGTGNMSAMAADEGLSNVENGVYTDTIDIVENESPGPSTDNEVKTQPDDTGNGDAPITEDDNKIELSGAVKSLTAGGQADGNIVTFGAGTNLSYTAEGNDEGRDSDCWWAGIEITAPEGAAENAQYQKITQWWNDADGTSAAWGSATAWSDNNDGTFWVPVKPEYFKSYGNTLNYRYQFDWNGDGTYEQQVVVKVTKDVQFSEIKRTHVARIGSVGYTNLQKAITEATDGQTVYVLKNSAGAKMEDAKTVNLYIPSNIKVRNCPAPNNKQYSYYLGILDGTLNLSGGGTVEGTNYGINAQGGTVNIDGVIVKSNPIAGKTVQTSADKKLL